MPKPKRDPQRAEKSEGLVPRNWRDQPIAPTDTPESRKRVGELIGEHAASKRKFAPDPRKKALK